MKIANTAESLRDLLTSVYVAVMAHVPVEGDDRSEVVLVPVEAWDALCTTILDAGEGREFEPMPLPWPPDAAKPD